MQIESPCVASLSWRLADTRGQTIDELSEPAEFLVGGEDLLVKVEEALQGQARGCEIELHLEPEHAFGDYKPELVCFEDRALFPSELEAGMAFEGLPEGSRTPDMPPDAIFIVTEVYPSHVVLDANHPLAGMALRLKVKVHDVREATPEEVERRSTGSPRVAVLAPPSSGFGNLH